MHQLAWPNRDCTALSHKMPETSMVNMGRRVKKREATIGDAISCSKLETGKSFHIQPMGKKDIVQILVSHWLILGH